MVPRLRDSHVLASSGRGARFTQPRDYPIVDNSQCVVIPAFRSTRTINHLPVFTLGPSHLLVLRKVLGGLLRLRPAKVGCHPEI